MIPCHRPFPFIVGAALLVCLVFMHPAGALSKERPQLKDPNPEAITFATDPAVQKQLAEAEKCIKRKSWQDAVRILQAILDQPKDGLVALKRKGPDAREIVYHAGGWAEADRLLAALPARGLVAYREVSGRPATALFKKATDKKDSRLLVETVRRFQHTEAGKEALHFLGMRYLDSGRSTPAAACFARLLQQPGTALNPATLYYASLAFLDSGDTTNGDRTRQQLLAKIGAKGLRLEDRQLSLKEVRQSLDKAARKHSSILADWPMVGGNPGRNAQSVVAAPLLEATWQTSTIHDEIEADNKQKHPNTEAWVKMGLDVQQGLKRPILPAFFPIAVQGKVFFRTYGAVQTVQIKDGMVGQVKLLAGDLYWRVTADGSLTTILGDAGNSQMLNQWQQMYRTSLHTIAFTNFAVGTLATDQSRIYVVEDLAIPPHPQWLQQWLWNEAKPAYGGNFKSLVNENGLRTYNVESGKLIWEVPERNNPADLGNSHFLGAPLPLDNRLYVLNEKKKKLRLLCLDPKQGKVLWTLNLATVGTPVTMDISRRTDAVNLAYADGVLVCPTGAGVILGIDLVTRGLRWTYPYREPPRPIRPNPWARPIQRPALEPEWAASGAVILDGKLTFVAKDGESIHCLNLRDGSLQWKVRRAGDLYLAGVHGGKVLLAGMDGCRALALNTGKQLWALQTGMPCGQGVAGKAVYYLPLAKGEICVIDLDKGRIKAHIRPHRKDVALGNLVFHDGYMLSQSATHIAAYPLLAVRIKEISALLAKNPNDPHGLTERGEMRLAEGKVQDAVDDLRKALANKPPRLLLPRVRLKLYEAFDEFFQKDFDTAAKKYLKEFEDLCRTDNADESRRRRSRFLYLVGSGRERQGKLVEALRLYVAFADLARPDQLITAPDDPKLRVRPDLWLRGHIKALLTRANAAQRKALEAEIEKQWDAIQKPKKAKG